MQRVNGFVLWLDIGPQVETYYIPIFKNYVIVMDEKNS